MSGSSVRARVTLAHGGSRLRAVRAGVPVGVVRAVRWSGHGPPSGVAEVDAVLLDQVGVALLVLLELRDDLVTRDLHRGEVVLLVEGLVLLGLERRLHGLRRCASWTSCGVPFGTVMKRYCATSTSRPCSCAVGTSGRNSTRSGPKTVSGTILPASMFSMASPTCRQAVSTWSPRRAVSAGAPPSKGIASAGVSLTLKVSAQASWAPVPTPVVP